MPSQCAFVYGDSRSCGRIPRRGEPFCPAHRAGSTSTEPGLEQRMATFAKLCQTSPLPEVIDLLDRLLASLKPLLIRRASVAFRLPYRRAVIAAAVARNRSFQQEAAARQQEAAARSRPYRFPLPTPSQPFASQRPVR